jgi:hypothetical protein
MGAAGRRHARSEAVTVPGRMPLTCRNGEVGWPWMRPPHTGSGPCCYRLDVAGSVPCSCAS